MSFTHVLTHSPHNTTKEQQMTMLLLVVGFPTRQSTQVRHSVAAHVTVIQIRTCVCLITFNQLELLLY